MSQTEAQSLGGRHGGNHRSSRRAKHPIEPSTRKGKRGKIGFAMRFHLGRGIEARLTDDGIEFLPLE